MECGSWNNVVKSLRTIIQNKRYCVMIFLHNIVFFMQANHDFNRVIDEEGKMVLWMKHVKYGIVIVLAIGIMSSCGIQEGNKSKQTPPKEPIKEIEEHKPKSAEWMTAISLNKDWILMWIRFISINKWRGIFIIKVF